MCVCPFHNDKNPSMKVDRRFHCFGCQADGDVIDFAARLYGLPVKEAALRLAQDFSIPYEDRAPPRQETPEQQFKRMEHHCFRVLSDYYHLLSLWEKEFASQTPGEGGKNGTLCLRKPYSTRAMWDTCWMCCWPVIWGNVLP